MTHDVYKSSMLCDLIERVSRKPYSELEAGKSYLSFSEEEYGNEYCENECPLQWLRCDGIKAECPGDCWEYDSHMESGKRKVYAADMVIGEILNKGYEAIGIAGIDEPFSPDWDEGYVFMGWNDAYESDSGICAGCVMLGTDECPQDILSESCPQSGKAWAAEHVAEALNEVML